MKRRTQFLGILLSLVIVAVSIELISLVICAFRTGSFFYISRPVCEPIGESGEPGETGGTKKENGTEAPDPSLTQKKFHPYFGYINKRQRVGNNHGFFSDRFYPLWKQNKDDYFIGLFGGSVAVHFKNIGEEPFVETLKGHPFFENRNIEILNFSAGGYKQPQQLFMLSYYLMIGQHFDLVINLDGFNEVALGARNAELGADAAMPSLDHLAPMVSLVNSSTMTAEQLDLMAEISAGKRTMNRFADKMNSTHVATRYVILSYLHELKYKRYTEAVFALRELQTLPLRESMIFIHQKFRFGKGSTLYEDIVLSWANSSRFMSTLLGEEGIPYYHILQPNQYHSNRTFSDEEAVIAIQADHPYREAVVQGYPLLLEEAQALRRSGVNCISAVEIFDTEERIVFKDSCCHFNDLGNDILARFIANAILDTGAF